MLSLITAPLAAVFALFNLALFFASSVAWGWASHSCPVAETSGKGRTLTFSNPCGLFQWLPYCLLTGAALIGLIISAAYLIRPLQSREKGKSSRGPLAALLLNLLLLVLIFTLGWTVPQSFDHDFLYKHGGSLTDISGESVSAIIPLEDFYLDDSSPKDSSTDSISPKTISPGIYHIKSKSFEGIGISKGSNEIKVYKSYKSSKGRKNRKGPKGSSKKSSLRSRDTSISTSTFARTNWDAPDHMGYIETDGQSEKGGEVWIAFDGQNNYNAELERRTLPSIYKRNHQSENQSDSSPQPKMHDNAKDAYKHGDTPESRREAISQYNTERDSTGVHGITGSFLYHVRKGGLKANRASIILAHLAFFFGTVLAITDLLVSEPGDKSKKSEGIKQRGSSQEV